MDHLDSIESESIYILREAFNEIERLGMPWSIGKDSNILVRLAMKAFFGRVPLPLIHLDSGNKFPEMYAFRGRYANEGGVELLRGVCPPLEEIDPTPPLPAGSCWSTNSPSSATSPVSKGSPTSGRC